MTPTVEFVDLRSLLPLASTEVPRPALGLYFFESLLKANDVPRDGVIHLGAHRGQEVFVYTMFGFRRALMVEPLPDEFQELQQRCTAMMEYARAVRQVMGDGAPLPIAFECVQTAVAEVDGMATLYRTATSQVSSLSRPLANDRPEYQSTQVQTETRTLDAIVLGSANAWKPEDFTYLRMNIQGSELRALQGGELVLKHIRAILLELNLEPRYDNQPTKDDFDAFLGARGFACTFAHYGANSTAHANLLYRRR